MSHSHVHDHAAAPATRDSLLCASASERVALAAAALAGLWLTVWWAIA